MIAVHQLAQGLFSQPAQHVGTVAATSDLDNGGKPNGSAMAVTPSASPAASQRTGKPAGKAGGTARIAPQPAMSSSGGTLLESADGSVLADCQPAGAYLLYWSPAPGFHADDQFRGPATVASVTFRGSGNSVVVHVSCQAGTPVAHFFRPAANDDGSGE
jgi:hypothetical protein